MRENMLFGGIWISESKPYMETFLKPYKELLWSFYHDGKLIFFQHASSFLSIVTNIH